MLPDCYDQLPVFFPGNGVVLLDAANDFDERSGSQTDIVWDFLYQLVNIETCLNLWLWKVQSLWMFCHEIIDIKVWIIPAEAKERVDEIVVTMVLELEIEVVRSLHHASLFQTDLNYTRILCFRFKNMNSALITLLHAYQTPPFTYLKNKQQWIWGTDICFYLWLAQSHFVIS